MWVRKKIQKMLCVNVELIFNYTIEVLSQLWKVNNGKKGKKSKKSTSPAYSCWL